MKKIFRYTSAVCAAATLVAANAAFADTNNQINTNTTTNTVSPTASTQPSPAPAVLGATTPPPAPVVPKLIEQIQQAKSLLRNVSLNYALNPHYKTVVVSKKKKTSKTVLSDYSLDAKDVALAVLDPASGQILITKASQTGRSFNFPDHNFDIRVIGYNGVNTNFAVNKPAGGVVLAWKILISATDVGGKAQILSGLREAIYVPYSSRLRTPEVSAYGENYLNTVLKSAVTALANTPSVSMPGKNITDAIKPAIIKALLYAEHMDTTEFLYTADTSSLVDKVNVLYAGNESDTFNYSVSSASARGLAQFIPSTYESLVSRHPELHLIPDFVAGMNDHVNAVKAEYLLIDDYIAAVHDSVPDSFNPAFIYDYGAASYNGGVARVAKAVRAYGANWDTDHSVQLAQAQSQVAAQSAEVRSLKAQIKTAGKSSKAKTTVAALNAQLSTANSKLTTLDAQLTTLQSAGLRNETVLYLNKMRKLIQVFNGEQVAKF